MTLLPTTSVYDVIHYVGTNRNDGAGQERPAVPVVGLKGWCIHHPRRAEHARREACAAPDSSDRAEKTSGAAQVRRAHLLCPGVIVYDPWLA